MPDHTRRRKFVEAYVKTGNATAAAKLAGYSKKSAHAQGHRLLKDAELAAAIAKKLNKATVKSDLTAELVLAEIRKHAFLDPATLFAEDGSLLSIHDMPADSRVAITSIEQDELLAGRGKRKVKVGTNKKIRLTDKTRNLEMLARHFKLLTDVHELAGKDGGPLVVLTMPANGSESAAPATPALTPAAAEPGPVLSEAQPQRE